MAERTNSAGAGSPDPLVVEDRARQGVRKRALVLAGAGSTGHAWEIGVIAGLHDAGLDVTEADVIIGTSAGSTVAAQLSMVAPTRLYTEILAEESAPSTGPDAPDGGSRTRAAAQVMQVTSEIIRGSEDPGDMRRRVGRAFLERTTSSADFEATQWRSTVAARLPSHDWPDRPLLIVAVDADTGEPVVFDRHSGVALVDAVAASTSNGWAYSIGDRDYINGGYRRNENADLAAGYGRVLVLSPFGGRSRYPMEWRMQLSAQLDELCAGGSRVETIFPEDAAKRMFGANAMDLSLRPPAARAGHSQGHALAERLAEFWR